ncbi:hypothetical protein F0L68_24800 [Solihabitans fulvus]|uniref:Uncharacterized protein n=1 Tax=Solihabitans fulvus TaxID=1892852 RepID=A0A5B2X2Y3_9PSEU|nr:hypothetical protein [Solihabitans fulvus]KAA2257521.1 hypothetical protein F0L68_24800 [Solihabitans fulvus]
MGARKYALGLSAAVVTMAVGGLTAPRDFLQPQATAQASVSANDDETVQDGKGDVTLTGRAQLTEDEAGVKQKQKSGDAATLDPGETLCTGAKGDAHLGSDGSMKGTVACQDDVVFEQDEDTDDGEKPTGQQVEVSDVTDDLASGDVTVTLDHDPAKKVKFMSCPEKSGDVTISGTSAHSSDAPCTMTADGAKALDDKFGPGIFQPGDRIAVGHGDGTVSKGKR